MNKTMSKNFFLWSLLVFLILSFIIIRPFLTYIVLALMLAYMFYPIYEKLLSKLKKPALSSTIMVIFLLIIIILPSLFIITKLIFQATSAYLLVTSLPLETYSELIYKFTNTPIDLNSYVGSLFGQARNFLLDRAPSLIGSITEVVLGLFVMFFLLFYLFIDGKKLYERFANLLPFRENHKKIILDELKSVTYAVIYGQLLTAIIQGTVGGIGLFIFGVENALFWGFIMIILSLIPVVGTPVIWAPIGVLQLINGHIFSGLGILLYGLIVVINIDNIIRPKLIGDKANIHPAVVLLGVLGGLSIFGFIGMFIGPLILAILIVLLNFFSEDFIANIM